MNYVKSGTSTDDFQYDYDRDGNVLYKKNVVNTAFSELYHANSSTSGDDNTAYDPLGRLTGFSRGTLTSSAITARLSTPSRPATSIRSPVHRNHSPSMPSATRLP